MVNLLCSSILEVYINSLLTFHIDCLIRLHRQTANLNRNSPPKVGGVAKIQRIFAGVVFESESSKVNSLILSIFTSLNSLFTCEAKFTIHLHFIHLSISSTVNISDIDKYH